MVPDERRNGRSLTEERAESLLELEMLGEGPDRLGIDGTNAVEKHWTASYRGAGSRGLEENTLIALVVVAVVRFVQSLEYRHGVP
jgi:hypothetical protein